MEGVSILSISALKYTFGLHMKIAGIVNKLKNKSSMQSSSTKLDSRRKSTIMAPSLSIRFPRNCIINFFIVSMNEYSSVVS
jgi:hypothetical protein